MHGKQAKDDGGWNPRFSSGCLLYKCSLTYVCSFRLSVSRLFDRVSVSVDLVSVYDRVEITETNVRTYMWEFSLLYKYDLSTLESLFVTIRYSKVLSLY